MYAEVEKPIILGINLVHSLNIPLNLDNAMKKIHHNFKIKPSLFMNSLLKEFQKNFALI